MNDTILTTIVLATVVAILIQVVGQVVVGFFRNRGKKQDDIGRFREDLMEQLDNLSKRLVTAESQLDEWRAKYYTLLQEHADLKSSYKDLQNQFNYMKAVIDVGGKKEVK